MRNQHMVKPDSSISLAGIDPDFCGKPHGKKQAEETLSHDRDELVRLQALLYAEARHAVLIVMQAMDTGGKDGAIRHVMSGVNPQGCSVTAFKAPSPEELAHDYLWRVHRAVHARGMIGILNRSHYEDVLVVRVHNLVPRQVWEARYDQINQFERYLSENGVTLLKFYLHISKQEQGKRLRERLEDPAKRWKFSTADLAERKFWNDYQKAYEDMLNKTSTAWAPWYVIPANHEWYRNMAVAQIVSQTLDGLGMRYPEPAEDLSKVVIPD
jgi:PPK2 family polyphosphate:nucleotide phosphotransferase